jgi:hypothetical protein
MNYPGLKLRPGRLSRLFKREVIHLARWRRHMARCRQCQAWWRQRQPHPCPRGLRMVRRTGPIQDNLELLVLDLLS